MPLCSYPCYEKIRNFHCIVWKFRLYIKIRLVLLIYLFNYFYLCLLFLLNFRTLKPNTVATTKLTLCSQIICRCSRVIWCLVLDHCLFNSTYSVKTFVTAFLKFWDIKRKKGQRLFKSQDAGTCFIFKLHVCLFVSPLYF